MTKPSVVNVELTLEESGWLCHLVAQELLKNQQPDSASSLFTADIESAVYKRMDCLWAKLEAANDELLGKK